MAGCSVIFMQFCRKETGRYVTGIEESQRRNFGSIISLSLIHI